MPTIDEIKEQTKEVATRWNTWGEWYKKSGEDLDLLQDFLAKLIANKQTSLLVGQDRNGWLKVNLKPIKEFRFKSLTKEQVKELEKQITVGYQTIEETIHNRAIELYNEGVENGYIEAIPEQ